MTTKRGVHVVPSQGKWAVKKEGTAKAASVHKTKDAAVKSAQKVAKQGGSELYVHGQDGRIRERNSYGSDPRPTKG